MAPYHLLHFRLEARDEGDNHFNANIFWICLAAVVVVPILLKGILVILLQLFPGLRRTPTTEPRVYQASLYIPHLRASGTTAFESPHLPTTAASDGGRVRRESEAAGRRVPRDAGSGSRIGAVPVSGQGGDGAGSTADGHPGAGIVGRAPPPYHATGGSGEMVLVFEGDELEMQEFLRLPPPAYHGGRSGRGRRVIVEVEG